MAATFDESTFPPRMIEMAKNSYMGDGQDVYMNSPFHKEQILFVPKGNRPSCRYCWNLLIIKTESNGYIQPYHLVFCDKCNKKWQLAYF
jgi:hypothetical protein